MIAFPFVVEFIKLQGVLKRWTQFQRNVFHDDNMSQLHKNLQTDMSYQVCVLGEAYSGIV